MRRSVKVFYATYPAVVRMNEQTDWFWQVSSGSKDHKIHTSPRAASNASIAWDYELLQEYLDGQFLLLEKVTGNLAITELVMTFAEMRTYSALITFAMTFLLICLVRLQILHRRSRTALKFTGAAPLGQERARFLNPYYACSEIIICYTKLSADFYQLDVRGTYKNTDEDEYYCKDGWTYLLHRQPQANSHYKVISYDWRL